MSARRILLVTDAYPPVIGGANQAVHFLAVALLRRGHEVAVATAWQPGSPVHEVRDGVEVHRLRDLTSRIPFISADPHKHNPPPFPDPEATLRFRRLLRSFRPDVVHTYGWISYSCAAAMRGSGVPLVLSIRDFGNFCALRTLLWHGEQPCSGPAPAKCRECARAYYGNAKGTVAAASVQAGRKRLAGCLSGAHFGGTGAALVARRHLLDGRAPFPAGPPFEVVAPSFRDPAADDPPDPEILARLPDQPFILYVGALRRAKGIENLATAHAALIDPPPLVMIGTPESDTPELPASVTVLESVPHGTVMAAWERALFGIFPSIVAETFGQVVHEAMSCGRAVIAADRGGPAELITDGVDGLLVRSESVEAIAAAMERLIANPELRERLGAAARERAAELGAEQSLARIEALYDAVTGGEGKQ